MSDSPSESGRNASGPVGRSFIRVYNLWHKRVKEALRGIGLTHPQYVVLASLGYLAQSGDEVSQVDIARNSDIDVMTVSTILRNLERDGLVTRRIASDDQRAKTVQMTVSGRSSLNAPCRLLRGLTPISSVDWARIGLCSIRCCIDSWKSRRIIWIPPRFNHHPRWSCRADFQLFRLFSMHCTVHEETLIFRMGALSLMLPEPPYADSFIVRPGRFIRARTKLNP